ncbi:MAG: esterase, partial [Saprospiraceae bacterium]|nr:esterase [Saprospiraceae bacterium]
MRIFYILAFLLGLANIITAQNLGCDGNRFVNEVFMETTETIGVQFGQNTTLGGNQKDLLMDIYEPTGDNLEMRPAIVLA